MDIIFLTFGLCPDWNVVAYALAKAQSMSFRIFFFWVVVVAIAVAAIAVSLFVVVVSGTPVWSFFQAYRIDSVTCSFNLVRFAILRSLSSSSQQFLEFD